MYLRTLRKRRGWTQDDLQKKSKIAQNSISRLERNSQARPSHLTVVALAKALGVDPNTIQFGPPPRVKKRRRVKAEPVVVPAVEGAPTV